jgi:propionyl-CoA carboxylase beta chain
MDLAAKMGAPLIGLNDSGGARIQEGVMSLAGYADIFLRNTLASGVIPQISAIMGPCAGGAVYSPAITDFILMVDKTSYMFITGPDVIKTVTHEEVTKEELGGAMTHNESGVAHFMAHDDAECLSHGARAAQFSAVEQRRRPAAQALHRSRDRADAEARHHRPRAIESALRHQRRHPLVVDDATFSKSTSTTRKTSWSDSRASTESPSASWPISPPFSPGRSTSTPPSKARASSASATASTFRSSPSKTSPAFCPAPQQEYGGIIRHGAKLLYAFAEATVPKITVITRKAYGGAYCVMASKHIRTDVNYAWPTAEIAVMGPEGAVDIVYKRELDRAENRDEVRKKKIEEFRDRFANPYVAADRGFVDAVIQPRDTRKKLIQALEMLATKRDKNPPKKHGNIPL